MDLIPRLKDVVRRQPWYAGIRRARLTRLAASEGAYPDWPKILGGDWAAWEAARDQANGPRILIATNAGLHFSAATIDSILAVALTLRGARVEVVLCDAVLPACMLCDYVQFPSIRRFSRNGPQADLCGPCQSRARSMYESLGIRVHLLSDLSGAEDCPSAQAPEPGHFLDGDIDVGEQALAGTLRFFARGILSDEPEADPVWRRFFAASTRSLAAARKLFAAGSFDVAVLHHGIYVPQGLFAAAAREAKVRVVAWHTSYRERTCIFSHGDTYHRTMLDEPVEAWSGLTLSPEQRQRILAYLNSRRHGAQDWISFQRGTRQDAAAIARDLNIDFSRPTVVLLTSVSWDARLHYPGAAFTSQEQWIIDTIRYFGTRPDLQLIVRVHPAEVKGTPPSRQRVTELVQNSVETLPPNVRVVPPEHWANTYAIAELCDSALIFNTKMGVELTAIGIPVIVAGEAWIRNKGLSHDACNAQDYGRLIARLPFGQRLNDAEMDRALAYAYHFFFRRMIPLGFLAPVGQWPLCRVVAQGIASFGENGDPGLEAVCQGILSETPFIYDGD